MAQLLQWEGDLCELRLDSSAFRYFSETAYVPSRKVLLRGLNRTLIRHVQGFTLVTLVHRDLIPQLQLDGSEGDFNPIICSSVSFDGDTMHKLKQDFVQKPENDFRQMILLIHFSVLSGITGVLPHQLTRTIRRFRSVAKYLRWGLGIWSLVSLFLSLLQIVIMGKPSWGALLWAILSFLSFWLRRKAPYVVRWVLACCIKWKLQIVRCKWKLQTRSVGMA